MLEINQVYLGDCLEVMKDIDDKSVDMILCDLPYEETANCDWDVMIPFEPLWKQYERIIKDNGIIVLTGNKSFYAKLVCSNLKLFKYDIIWEKTQATGHLNANKQPLRAHENIAVFYKKQPTYNPQKTSGHKPMNSYTKRLDVVNKSNVYGKCKIEMSGGGETDRYPRSVLTFASDKQKYYLHPSQKPLALGRYLIKTYTNKGDLVLDNCCGSGTFPLAAKLEERNFIGIEKDENYFNIANNRILERLELNAS